MGITTAMAIVPPVPRPLEEPPVDSPAERADGVGDCEVEEVVCAVVGLFCDVIVDVTSTMDVRVGSPGDVGCIIEELELTLVVVEAGIVVVDVVDAGTVVVDVGGIDVVDVETGSVVVEIVEVSEVEVSEGVLIVSEEVVEVIES